MATETPLMATEDTALALQDRFVRGFAWLRKVAGMTQSAVADAAGWQQPYVARLEDARSPLLSGLSRLERYADACGFTTVVVFVDKESGAVVRTLNLGDAGDEAAARLLPRSIERATTGLGKRKRQNLESALGQAARSVRYERS